MRDTFNGIEYELELVKFSDLEIGEKFIEVPHWYGMKMDEKEGPRVSSSPEHGYTSRTPNTICLRRKAL